MHVMTSQKTKSPKALFSKMRLNSTSICGNELLVDRWDLNHRASGDISRTIPPFCYLTTEKVKKSTTQRKLNGKSAVRLLFLRLCQSPLVRRKTVNLVFLPRRRRESDASSCSCTASILRQALSPKQVPSTCIL